MTGPNVSVILEVPLYCTCEKDTLGPVNFVHLYNYRARGVHSLEVKKCRSIDIYIIGKSIFETGLFLFVSLFLLYQRLSLMTTHQYNNNNHQGLQL